MNKSVRELPLDIQNDLSGIYLLAYFSYSKTGEGCSCSVIKNLFGIITLPIPLHGAEF